MTYRTDIDDNGTWTILPSHGPQAAAAVARHAAGVELTLPGESGLPTTVILSSDLAQAVARALLAVSAAPE